MQMTRRQAIRNCFIFSVGAALLPSCLQENDTASIALKKIKITGQQEKLVAELGETIIPKTDTPGAKDLYAHLFVLKMVDDLYNQADQKQFEKGIKDFDDLAKKQFDRPFVQLTPQQRNTLVASVNSNKKGSDDAIVFYKTVKKFTAQVYTTSQFYLTEVQEWKLVPGKFYGCVPVASFQKEVSN